MISYCSLKSIRDHGGVFKCRDMKLFSLQNGMPPVYEARSTAENGDGTCANSYTVYEYVHAYVLMATYKKVPEPRGAALWSICAKDIRTYCLVLLRVLLLRASPYHSKSDACEAGYTTYHRAVVEIGQGTVKVFHSSSSSSITAG